MRLPVYPYFLRRYHDRIKGEGQIPPLIDIIQKLAQEDDRAANYDSSST
ncbi:MAG: hypothetical protein ACPGWR_21425 [Ardenticatenaceae bacterium]